MWVMSDELEGCSSFDSGFWVGTVDLLSNLGLGIGVFSVVVSC